MHALFILSLAVLSQNADAAPPAESPPPQKTGDPEMAYDLSFVLDFPSGTLTDWRRPLEEDVRAAAKEAKLSLYVIPLSSDELKLYNSCGTMNATCARLLTEQTQTRRLLFCSIHTTANETVVGCDILDAEGVTSKTGTISDRGGLGLEEARRFLRSIIAEEARRLTKPRKVATDPWKAQDPLPVPAQTRKPGVEPTPRIIPVSLAAVSAGSVAVGLLCGLAGGGLFTASRLLFLWGSRPMAGETQRAYFARVENANRGIIGLLIATGFAGTASLLLLIVGVAMGGVSGTTFFM